jgi:hypothetical protein
MPLSHRPVPRLPSCPRAKSIAAGVRRSYPTGKRKFSRAVCGREFELSISSIGGFPPNVRANLVTTLNANRAAGWMEFPFEFTSEKTLVCKIIPDRPGLYSFWTRFSIDGGNTWLHDPVPDAWVLVDPVQIDHLRMYTLIPAVSGTIADWGQQLNYIKQMGFNAVHLLPLTTLDTSLSPYSARNLFDVDPLYLDKNSSLSGLAQLEEFVEQARRLEIRLCFDLVLNHVGTDSLIAQQAPEWIVPDEEQPDGLRRARYWSGQGWENWNDIVLINYEHSSQYIRSDIHGYMTQYALFWARYASQTNGLLRFDNLHSSDKPFVDALTQILRDEFANVGVLAEYFTDSSTLLDTVPKWGLNLVLATPWDSRFVPQLREYLKYIHSISEQIRFFMPITSHDSGSPAQEFGGVESTIPRYVAAALFGTGATGITQGVEWGIEKKIEFIGRQPRLNPPADGPTYGPFLRKVNDILSSETAFRRGNNCDFVDNNHHAVIAAFRKDDRPDKLGFLVACNFDIFNPHLLDADLSPLLRQVPAESCVDLITGQSIALNGSNAQLSLPPCSAMVIRISPAIET